MKSEAFALEPAISDLGLLTRLSAGTGDLPVKLMRYRSREYVFI